MIKIGIIGTGYVGDAIRRNINQSADILCYDTDPNKYSNCNFNELFDTAGLFVCVPSPSNSDGSCNTAILESVLQKLTGYKGVIISKVTAPPNVYNKLNEQFPNLVYVPEFLTASNSYKDYAEQKWIIIGGASAEVMERAKNIIAYTKDKFTVNYCSIQEASLVKYTINSFLATKVIFMNEIEQLAEKSNCDYQTLVTLLKLDNRFGNSHLQVPGPDGMFGFGGACFPKDTQALLSYADSIGVDLNVLKESVKKNKTLRLHKPK